MQDVFTTRNLLYRSKIDWLRVVPQFTLLSCEFRLAGCWRATCACAVANCWGAMARQQSVSRNAHENSVNLGATPNQAILDGESGFTRQEDVELQQKSLQEAIEIMTAGAKKSEKSNF